MDILNAKRWYFIRKARMDILNPKRWYFIRIARIDISNAKRWYFFSILGFKTITNTAKAKTYSIERMNQILNNQ